MVTTNDYATVTEAALEAVSLRYAYPEAHFHLGVASVRLKAWQQAETALRIALSQHPDFAPAHRWLSKLYRHLRRPDLAETHEHALRDAERRR